jgi:hypothetical protein
VVVGKYHSTHDYQMEAVVQVPGGSAAQALTDLKLAFGKCSSELPSPLTTEGMQDTCVMANDDVFNESEEPSSRLYLIGTGVRDDGTRVIAMVIKSR